MGFIDTRTEMGKAIADHDWSGTQLGPIDEWPAALRVAVGILVSSSFPKSLCWGSELTMLYNDAFVPILGRKHPCLGRPFREVWSEVWDEIGPIAERALEGDATYVEDFPLRLMRSNTPEQAHFTFCYSPVRDETGAVCGILDTVIETTGKVQAEQLATLRNRELVHRVRNVFALVSVLVNQTHRNANSLEEAWEKIQERLGTLDRAQNVLLQRELSEAEIAEVVEQALAPFRGRDENSIKIIAPEPDMRVGRQQVVALTLALHELGTNAMKYGALSVPGGHVELSWGIDWSAAEPEFHLVWQEHGGPAVTGKAREGFGTFLVERALPGDFDGRVTLDYAETGVRMVLSTTPEALSPLRA